MNNILIYLIYVGVSILIFLINSYLGLLLIVFSYLLLFILNYRKNSTIFNYIQFYLLACWILTFSKVFNVYLLDKSLFYEEWLYFLSCVIISGIITIFFKLPNKNTYLFEKKFNEVNLPYFYPLSIILLVFIIFSSQGLFGGDLKFIVQNLLYLFPLLIASILYLNSKKNKFFPNILFIILFIFYSEFRPNRGGFLIVPLFFFLTILINNHFQFNIKKNFYFIFSSIVIFFILFVLGDLYKGSPAKNLFDFINQFSLNDLFIYTEVTRYKFDTGTTIYNYYYTLGTLTDDQREMGGNIFTQFNISNYDINFQLNQ